jgi:hypothetical protein
MEVAEMSGPPEELAPERLARYRGLAAEAQDLAEKAGSDDLRQAYLTLAQGWAALAEDLEKALRRSLRS